MDQNFRMQWYVITAIGGQEESIASALREKMNNYGYAEKVKEIRVFMKKEITEDIFSKNDPEMPATLRKTKTTSWEALPDGRYKRTKTKIKNRFPGYIFIQADLDPEIWYAIRNTVGVLGFVGSSGKGALPIPCSIDEYQRLISQAAAHEYAARIEKAEEAKAAEAAKPKKEAKPKLTEAPFKVGQSVELTTGSFAGTVANVVGINLEKQTAKVEFEFFGRVSTVEINFDDAKLVGDDSKLAE